MKRNNTILFLIQTNIKYIVFLLFLLLEFISYSYKFFIILNSFIFSIICFHIIYFIFGFTSQENDLRIKEPIKFKFSLTYLLKLIKRNIKIKCLLVKNLIKDKRRTISELILIISVIIISLLIVRYFRWHLLLEIFQTFNIKETLLKFLTLLSFSIIECYTWVIRLINPEDMFKYLYLIEKPKKKSKVLDLPSKISDYTGIIIFYMKKGGSKASDFIANLIPRIKVPQTEITTQRGFRLPEYILGKDYGYKRNEAKYVLHKADGNVIPFDKSDVHMVEECLALPNVKEQVTYLQKNPHSFLHQINDYITYCNYKESAFKPTSPKDASEKKNKWLNLLKFNPRGISKKMEVIEKFDTHFTNEIMPVYAKNYFKVGMQKNEFNNIIYEVLFHNSLQRLHPNSDYFGIPASDKNNVKIFSQPDAVYYLNDKQIKFQQIKYTSDFIGREFAILKEFDDRYKDTDYCVLAFRDYFLVQENFYDEPKNFKSRKRIATCKTLIPFDPELNAEETIVKLKTKTPMNKIYSYMKNVTDAVNRQSVEWNLIKTKSEIGIRKLPSYSPGSVNFQYIAEYSNEAMENYENVMRELKSKINSK